MMTKKYPLQFTLTLILFLLTFCISCKSEKIYLTGNYEARDIQNENFSLDFNKKIMTQTYINYIAINTFKLKRIDNNGFIAVTSSKVFENKKIEKSAKNKLNFTIVDKGNILLELHSIHRDSLKYRIIYSKNLENTISKGILIKKHKKPYLQPNKNVKNKNLFSIHN